MSPLHSDPVGAGSGLAGAPTGSRRGRPDAFGDRPEALSGPSGSAPGRSSGANRGSGLAGGRPNPGGGGPDRSGDRPDPAGGGGGGGGTGAARGGPGAGLSGAVAAGPAELSPRPLLGLGLPELQDWCVEQGQPAFRARQLQEWIYERGARSLAAITVLPKAWRQQLAAVTPGLADSPAGSSLAADTQPHSSVPRPSGPPAPLAVAAGPFVPAQAAVLAPGLAATAAPSAADAWIGRSRELLRSESRDGTVKLLLGTADGLSLETVGIPSGERLTVCVSSQVGCPMACRFCATGKGGLQRSLALHEIIDQVLSIREVMGRRPSHVVFMGMGEPLLNLETVLAAIDCLCTDLGMAQRQITISTVGVPAALPSLAERALQRLGRAQFTLAVSLHAPDQALRQRLIPTAHAYPLERLLDDCRRYVAITGRRVSFEYILLGGVNDQPRHAEALARRLRGFQSHVNLIAYNPIAEEEFRRPSPEAVEAFRHALQQRRIAVSVRASRGLDADAACGQLRRRLVGGAPAARQREARAD